jgi:hypothetical protein
MTFHSLHQTPEFQRPVSALGGLQFGGECGIGAVVPWAGRLWLITYTQHSPGGSDDKLYEIDADLQVTIRPESIGGTPANRMIHRESTSCSSGRMPSTLSGTSAPSLTT